MKNFLAYSLQRLGVEHIDIYRPARLDPDRADRGDRRRHRRHGEGRTTSGISDCPRSAPTPFAGRTRVHPIVDLQIEYSLIARGIESGILKTCRELGIGITAYGVLSRGLISGHWSKDRSATQDFRLDDPALPGQQSRRQSGIGRTLCAPSPPRSVRRRRRSRSPGSPRRATTSCRWSARGAATG